MIVDSNDDIVLGYYHSLGLDIHNTIERVLKLKQQITLAHSHGVGVRTIGDKPD